MRYVFNVQFAGNQAMRMTQDAVGVQSAQDLLWQGFTEKQRVECKRIEFVSFGPGVWKPTQAECDLIKKAAAKECGKPLKHLRLEPGRRYNIDDDTAGADINWLLVSKLHGEEMGNDTDLSETWYWEEFRKGVTLTVDGRAVVDFYIRPINEATADKHHYDHMMGNVTVTYEHGRMTRIDGVYHLGHNYLDDFEKEKKA